MSLTRLMICPSRCLSSDGGHRIVDQRADGGLRRAGLQVLPARFLRHPENSGGAVFVRIFRVGALRLLRFEFRVLGLEGVGNVLQENQAEDHVLVLGGIHVVAQRIGGGPQLGFEAEGCGGIVLCVRFGHGVSFKGCASIVTSTCRGVVDLRAGVLVALLTWGSVLV